MNWLTWDCCWLPGMLLSGGGGGGSDFGEAGVDVFSGSVLHPEILMYS